MEGDDGPGRHRQAVRDHLCLPAHGRRGQRHAAHPEPAPAGFYAPAKGLGVHHPQAGGADDEMIYVGAAAGDGEVVQDRPARRRQMGQESGRGLLACRAPGPAVGVTAWPARPGEGGRPGGRPQPHPSSRPRRPSPEVGAGPDRGHPQADAGGQDAQDQPAQVRPLLAAPDKQGRLPGRPRAGRRWGSRRWGSRARGHAAMFPCRGDRHACAPAGHGPAGLVLAGSPFWSPRRAVLVSMKPDWSA